MGIPPDAVVDDVICIPAEAVDADLQKAVVDGNAVSAFQKGLFKKALWQAIFDVNAARGVAAPATATAPAAPGPPSGPIVVQVAPEDPLVERISRVLSQAAPGSFLPMASEDLLSARKNFYDVRGNPPLTKSVRPTLSYWG